MQLKLESGFKRTWKVLQKKRYPDDDLRVVIEMLLTGDPLPGKYKDHSLSGNWKGFRECHIRANWLLIYRLTDTEIILVATGTHDDLF